MAIAFVQVRGNQNGAPSTTAILAYNGAVTAGNLLVCAISWAAASIATVTATVSDSVNGSWTAAASSLATDSTNGWRSQIFYRPDTGAGTPTVTVTFSASATESIHSILEYSGVATTSPLDVSNGATGASSVTSVPLTTTTDHDLLIGHTLVSGSNTAGGGFTDRVLVADNPTIDKLDQTPAGAVNVVFSNTNTFWLGTAAAFKISGTPTATSLIVPRRAERGLIMSNYR